MINFTKKSKMTKVINLILIMAVMVLMACGMQSEKPEANICEEQLIEESPREMLNQAYQLFKEGDDKGSIKLANRVLEIGRETKNDTLIGKALTSLCRNSQRKLDTTRLAELSAELMDLAASSGNQKWLMYRAHMNAEMWRLIENMDRAEGFYNESMKISFETGSMGMYTIDHFNKSFVSIAKGDFETAKELIKKYYQLRKEENQESEDAYGLIALAYLLEQQGNYEGAHEVATVTRRLFKEQNLFPEPPDEKPLLMVELKVKEMLEQSTLEEISKNSASESVSNLLEKYLE
jgi:tetratricopeptide (TPR) repeat protein